MPSDYDNTDFSLKKKSILRLTKQYVEIKTINFINLFKICSIPY